MPLSSNEVFCNFLVPVYAWRSPFYNPRLLKWMKALWRNIKIHLCHHALIWLCRDKCTGCFPLQTPIDWHHGHLTGPFSSSLSGVLPTLFLPYLLSLCLTFALIILWIGVTASEEVRLMGKPDFLLSSLTSSKKKGTHNFSGHILQDSTWLSALKCAEARR